MPLSGSNDSPSPNSSSLMSPVGLFDIASSSMTTSCGSLRRSQAGWLWAFETVSFPPAIRYWSEVAFQEAPSSARSKSSVNGASMTGTLARQPGRRARASPSNEASRAPTHASKIPPSLARQQADGGRRQVGDQLVEQAPANAAIADAGPRRRPAAAAMRSRITAPGEDHVGAAWIEADRSARAAPGSPRPRRASSRPRSARDSRCPCTRAGS